MPAENGLDPVIHGAVRLRVMVTLATLRDGDNLSFTRLQELLGVTPGNLITHLRKLEDAGYVTTVKSGGGVNARTSVSLSRGAARPWTPTQRSCGSYWIQPAPTGPARINRARQPRTDQSVFAAAWSVRRSYEAVL